MVEAQWIFLHFGPTSQCFDEDRNLENARQVFSLGVLTLLIKRIDDGEIHEKESSALIILCCVRAKGSCRSYLAENINKNSLLELIVLGRKQNSSGYALSLLFELLHLDRYALLIIMYFFFLFFFSSNFLYWYCFGKHNRRTKILKFLRGLKDGWSGLNTLHIFFIYLQKAPPEERPLVAVILLMLDLMVIHSTYNCIYGTIGYKQLCNFETLCVQWIF